MAMASTSMSTPAGLVQGRGDGPENVVDRTSTSGSTSSLGTKLMASTTGAIMTASLMTPFDVLKTRMQTASQTPLPSSSIIPPSYTPPTASRTRAPRSKPNFTPNTHPNHSSGHNNHNYLRATHAHAHAQDHHPAFPFTNPHRLTLPLHPTSAQVQAHTLHPCNISLYAPRLSLMSSSSSSLGSGSGVAFIPNPNTSSFDLSTSTTTSTITRSRTTALQEILSIIQTSGPRGLWKGTGTAVLQSIPSAGIYMVGYDYLVRGITERVEYSRARSSGGLSGRQILGAEGGNMKNMSGGGEGWMDKGGIPFLAGCLARTVSATICSPLELFRTRLQARPAAGQPTPTYASTLSTILQTITHSGPSSLYRGLGLTLLRDVPFSGLYWVVFEGFRRRIVEGRELTDQDLPIHTLEPGAGRSGNGGGSGPGDRSKLSLWETFTAGAGSGMLAALVTQPFDVLKTRKQVFQQPPPGLPALNTATDIAFKSKFKFNLNSTIAAVPEPATMSMSIPRHLVHIVRTEGLKALFSGVGPRTLKIAPACGMMLGCYEGVGRIFGEGEK